MDKSLWQLQYLSGLSVRDIAGQSATTAMTVSRYLRKIGTEMRPVGRVADLDPKERQCSKCKKIKPITEFYRNTSYKSGYGYDCKKCPNAYSGRNLKKYGLTKTALELMYKAQDHKCAICGIPEGERLLHIDHCHKTGKVRGLLCERCNLGIGAFNDSLEYLNTAILYLKYALNDRASPKE
ncbi:hypothetical protein CCAX7_12160 [Capsulimonas corticalis]|uniref:Uncharacterized protein n=1 Tax=Capsulimonas corticalis TaxID=2219043 RepID=A0A402D4D2_9BACT|nr:endonuclease VII domain-containing protein [Capsulimonas corticalis]BDI29165.1 hypothetical protein CCAX7_12160 [Capsulimonas corticalis]